MKVLATTVVMWGEVYGPGDVPPPHIAERITNPACWTTGPSAGGEPAPLPGGDAVPVAAPATSGIVGDGNVVPAGTSGAVPQAAPAGDLGLVGSEPAATQEQAAVDAAGPAQDSATEPAAEPADEDVVVTETVVEEVVEDDDLEDDEDDELPALPEPPRSGKGSGEAAWRAFAYDRGVDVAEDDSRDEIIAACKVAGVIS